MSSSRVSARLQDKNKSLAPKNESKVQKAKPKATKEKVKETVETVQNTKIKFKVGEMISSLKLQDQDGNEVDIMAEAKNHGLVIFFYPKASTPGCTTQGCLFRDNHAHFEKAGYKVFGCSADSCKSQKTFQTKQSFPYSLLSDPKYELISACGSKEALKIIRNFLLT
jgi:peroxiredoxin Q/BCP